MRLVGYRCDKSGKQEEELFNDSEKKPKKLKRECDCGGSFIKFDVKNNCHRWNYNDRPL